MRKMRQQTGESSWAYMAPPADAPIASIARLEADSDARRN